MASNTFVLSIDGGTVGVRVGIIDDTGIIVASGSATYQTAFPRDGWAEQDPASWWSALQIALQRCFASTSIEATDIEGICLDATTCTLVTLDEGNNVLDSALLWMDVRATDQARRVTETGHRALQYCPSGCSAEWMLCKAIWIRECDPDRYRKTRTFLDYTDWFVHKLTGERVLNLNTATQRWFYNCREWEFPVDLYHELGAEDLVERIPKRVVPSGEHVGVLNVSAASDLGLVPGVPVFQGGGDAFVASLGLGITRPGPMGMIAGSSNVFVGEIDSGLHGPGLYGGFPHAILPDLWLIEAGQASAGSILAWFRRNFLKDLPEETAYGIMDEEASHVPIGSNGLIVLDNFQGNRSPFSDSTARGAITGLSLASGRAEIFRAVMEGIAYGIDHIIHAFTDLGIEVPELVACGGATKSSLYMQIISDVTGVPIRLSCQNDVALIGGGILAANGLGWYENISDAAKHMSTATSKIEPDFDAHERYAPIAARHAALYHLVKDENCAVSGT